MAHYLNVSLHVDSSEVPSIQIASLPLVTFTPNLAVSVTGSYPDTAAWFREFAARLHQAAAEMDIRHAQEQEDRAATQAELERLRSVTCRHCMDAPPAGHTCPRCGRAAAE